MPHSVRQNAARSRLSRRLDTPSAFDLAHGLDTPIWVYDIDHCRILHANSAACHLWQAACEDELKSRDLSLGMSSAVANRLREYQSEFLDRNACFHELWTLFPNGVATSVTIGFKGFVTADHRMATMCEVVGGLSKESPDNLRSAEAVLHTDVMIGLFKLDGTSLYLNPAAHEVFEGSDRSLHNLFADPSELSILMFDLDRSEDHRAVVRVRTSNGARWFEISARNCRDAATGDPAILLTATDVTELKNARDKARTLAERDTLTGCFNRSYLQDFFDELAPATQTCAAIYFDVDHFKQMNDQFGHEVGDIVLKEVAARASTCLRDGDILVRLGGDEFVMLLTNLDTDTDISQVMDPLLLTLSQPIHHNAAHITLSVSIGVTTFVPGGLRWSSVIRNADIALYKSKTDGRNRWTMFDDALGTLAEERMLVEMDIKRAIEDEEFILHYQPRVELPGGRIVAAEALVRWNHPERGLILPGHFIPTCEETGMILELGHKILRRGCEQAFHWHRQGRGIVVSINISPRQFDDPRLMASLEDFAARSGFPEGGIELEITEGVLIGNLATIQGKLEKIRELGYRIAIDDFGTGYSNLAYISRFPLNSLKIDRSFIQQLPQSGPIISLILTLSRQIGARSVAEGVETREEIEWLVSHGCDEAQGYYHHHPLTIADFEALLDQRARGGGKQR